MIEAMEVSAMTIRERGGALERIVFAVQQKKCLNFVTLPVG